MSEQRKIRMERSQNIFDEAMREPLDTPPLPWTAQQVIHDGHGWQLFDASNKPVLGDLLRDPEDAAWLMRFVNHLEQERVNASREHVHATAADYTALRALVLSARHLLWNLGNSGIDTKNLDADLRKALEPFSRTDGRSEGESSP